MNAGQVGGANGYAGEIGGNWIGRRELIRLEGVMPSKLFDAALCRNPVHLKGAEVQAANELQESVLFSDCQKLRQEK